MFSIILLHKQRFVDSMTTNANGNLFREKKTVIVN